MFRLEELPFFRGNQNKSVDIATQTKNDIKKKPTKDETDQKNTERCCTNYFRTTTITSSD